MSRTTLSCGVGCDYIACMITPAPPLPALDIVNTKKLASYLELRQRALLQLKNDKVHNVYGQIVAMVDGDRT